MLHGDISNKIPPILLIRLGGNTLIDIEEPKGLKKLFKGKAKYNLGVIANEFLVKTHMYRDYSITIIITEEDERLIKDCWFIADSLPHFQIIKADEYLIDNLLKNGCYMCYIDNDERMRGKINSPHCYTIEEAMNFIR